MFAPDDPEARVVVAVVALGDRDRVRACIESLIGHSSQHPFRIACVINPDGRSDDEPSSFPAGVAVHRPALNLGWAGGLHLVRATTPPTADYLVWAQDDMVVADGWLDALVETADAHPDAGAVGSVEVDAQTRLANGHAGGFAGPPTEVRNWNPTDVVRTGEYVDGQGLDWVTSKGLLTRLAAWDDVHGPDPRLFPLNHVDKDYSIHLRVHGWRLLVATRAHVIHEKHRSAPMPFREFLVEWQEGDFDRRWSRVATTLARGEAASVPHECATWGSGGMAEIEHLVGREASRMVVPAAKYLAARAAHDAARRAEVEAEIARIRQTVSWRATAPLRLLRGRFRNAAERRRTSSTPS